jgi:DNA-binding transcriptional LysR family regulator
MVSPSFDQLDCFGDIVEGGSFSAAARKRGVSQPAVSLQLRTLERALGLRLVERSGRHIRPTPAGQDLLTHVRRLREEMAAVLDTLSPHRDGSAGRVRIGTGATACIYLLPPALRQLRRQHPGLEVTVTTGNTGDMLRLVEDNAVDLALVTMPAAGRSLAVERLYEDELVGVLPATYGAHPAALRPADFLERPLVLYEAGGNTRRIIDAWFLRAGLQAKPVMELGSVEAIKQLVGAGLGAAILPSLAIRRSDRGLVSAPLKPRLKRSLALVLRRDKRRDAGLRALTRALADAASS